MYINYSLLVSSPIQLLFNPYFKGQKIGFKLKLNNIYIVDNSCDIHD